MKLLKLFISVAIVLTATQLNAQNDLTIEYIQTINIHKSLSSSQMAMKAFIPETIKKKIVYKYTDNKARLKEGKMEETENTSINIHTSGGSSDALIDYKANKATEYHKIMNKNFCVEKQIKDVDFKYSDETKEILGYKCTKAIYKNREGEDMTFWIANNIDIKATPLVPLICNKGAILAIDSDKVSFVAKSISKKDLVNTEIVTPPTARKITAEQLEDLQQEQMEEMQQNN